MAHMSDKRLKIGDQCWAFGPLTPSVSDLLVGIVSINSRSKSICAYPMPYLIQRIDGQPFYWASDQPIEGKRPGSCIAVWAARCHLRRAGDRACPSENWDASAFERIRDRRKYDNDKLGDDEDDDEDEDDHPEEPSCPYCDSLDECPHYLLMVDTSEQSAVGGLLSKAFHERYYKLREANEKAGQRSWREAFEAILSVVERLADAERVQDFEAGPGTASRNLYFYASSESRAGEILQAFIAGGVPPSAPGGTGVKDD